MLNHCPLARTPAARAPTTEQRHASSAEAAALDERTSRRTSRPLREELHDPADRVRAIQVAATAALHLDAIERDLRESCPSRSTRQTHR